MKIKNKSAQVTIFIIIGLVLVGAVLAFFIIRGGINVNPPNSETEDPRAFLQNCLEEKIQIAIKNISLSGGKIDNVLSERFKFDEEDYYNISYLCYTEGYYKPCIMQEPLFIKQLENELENYLSEDVENCYSKLANVLEEKDYVVDARYSGFEIELQPGQLKITYLADLIITKSETIKLEDFSLFYETKFYDLAIVAQEIANQHARFCNFENLGFMLFYPEFDIEKYNLHESKIYTIKHRKTNEVFRIAIRSCAIPAGLF